MNVNRKTRGRSSVVLGLLVATLMVAPTTPASAATLSYPGANVPCSHAPYAVPGACAGYDWGPVPDGNVNTTYSERGYGYRNCTDYVAWRLESLGVSTTLTRGRGNGKQWDDSSTNVTLTTTPEVGDAAVFEGTDALGHVAFVEEIRPKAGGGYEARVSEYNQAGTGIGTDARWVTADRYVDFNGVGTSLGGSSQPSTPAVKATSSTDDAAFGGDFNGDGWGDSLVIRQRTSDVGADIHILYGGTGVSMFSYSPTFARSLPGPLWDWAKMKFAVGYFNSDSMSDLAVIDQRADGGANVHILYGAAQPFQVLTTQRNLEAPAWNWSLMKVVSGNFNGDGFDDVVIGHKQGNGGMGVHLLLGGVGTAAFANPVTFRRALDGPSWSWDDIKLAAGPFDADASADLAVVHKRGDGGLGVHLLNGAPQGEFALEPVNFRNLPGPGWNWDLVKLASGQFNTDLYADIAILHKTGNGGIGVHALYGNVTPFQDVETHRRTLPGGSGAWSWDDIKIAAGPFNDGPLSDLAIFHRIAGDEIGVHALYGDAGLAMFNHPGTTSVRQLAYNWYLSKIA